MAKPASIKIRLNSSADTGFFYVTKKNARTKTDKLVMKKYRRRSCASTWNSKKARSSKTFKILNSKRFRPASRRAFSYLAHPKILEDAMTNPDSRLSREQRRRFDERGLVKLEGFVPRNVAEEMADSLWRELARKEGMHRGRPETWQTEIPWGFQALRKGGAFAAMATSELRDVLDSLIGHGGWSNPPNWGQPLVRFPVDAKRWDIPHQVWHLDLTPDTKRPGLVGRLFVLLAAVRATGGGTLVATGSHRIAAALTPSGGGSPS